MTQLISPGFDPYWPAGDVGFGLRELFGPQILGRYKLWGDDLVTDVSELESPLDLSANPPWVPIRCTVTTGHADPDGGANAGALIEDGTPGNTHTIFQTMSEIATGPIERIGVYMKAGGRNFGNLVAGPVYAIWDLTTGAITAAVNCTPAPGVAVGGGWFFFDAPDCVGVFTSGASSCQIRPSIDGTIGGRNYNGTPGLTALYAYKPYLEQTSILTAPNHPTLAARNLELYGNRYDFTNPNKSSQLVVGADVWDGLPGAIASGANWIACDEMAARYTGEDKQIFVAVSVQSATLGASDYIVGLGNSADNNPYQALGTGAGPNWGAIKDDNVASGPAVNTSATACDGNRHILAWSHDGTKETIWLDGVVTSISDAASDLGAMTVDQVTLFALRKIAAANHAPVVAREAVIGMAANPAQMLATFNLMRAGNPL